MWEALEALYAVAQWVTAVITLSTLTAAATVTAAALLKD